MVLGVLSRATGGTDGRVPGASAAHTWMAILLKRAGGRVEAAQGARPSSRRRRWSGSCSSGGGSTPSSASAPEAAAATDSEVPEGGSPASPRSGSLGAITAAGAGVVAETAAAAGKAAPWWLAPCALLYVGDLSNREQGEEC